MGLGQNSRWVLRTNHANSIACITAHGSTDGVSPVPLGAVTWYLDSLSTDYLAAGEHGVLRRVNTEYHGG